MDDSSDPNRRFRELHASGTFIMPNAWDVGSARILENMGFPAIATTSSGHAASLGKHDQQVTRDELLGHAELMAGAVAIPVSIDSERCFGDDPTAVAETVRLLATTGAAGCSIEDYDPATGKIDDIEVATERVAAAAGAARAGGLVLTARAENHIYGTGHLDDTIARLRAYREAGADVVYAPALVELADITAVVAATDAPINVLARRTTPPIAVLEEAGVRRISTGGSLALAAYSELVRGATELLESGTSEYTTRRIGLTDLLG
jgi:2-methylisocitrate lyase-like PEP mutase family enzyme